METKTIISEQFKVQARDFVRGLIMFVLGAIVTFFYELLPDFSLADVNFETILKVASSAAITYIFKNWVLEPPKVITITDSNQTAKKVETVISDKLE